MMKIIVSDRADERLQETASYIRMRFGRKAKKEFRQEFHALVRDNPYLGPTEPLLEGKPKTYRCIVFQRVNKVVYFIEDDIIHIVDFWDVRRDPGMLANQV